MEGELQYIKKLHLLQAIYKLLPELPQTLMLKDIFYSRNFARGKFQR